jgi:hypothetical protein
MGVQPERCALNPHRDEPIGKRKHNRDPMGQWLGCLAVAHMTSGYHGVFRNQPTTSRIAPTSGAAPPLDTPSTTRRLNLARPRAASGDHCLMSPPSMSRRAPRAARRGTRSTSRRPRPMMKVVSTGKKLAPACRGGRRLQQVLGTATHRPL